MKKILIIFSFLFILTPILFASSFSGGGSVSTNTLSGYFVSKAGDTMTGNLTAPNYITTYGITAATGTFNGSLSINDTTTDAVISMWDVLNSTNVYLNTNGNSYLKGGNVGINTSSPETKLSVNGLVSYSIDSSTQVLYSTSTIAITNSYAVIQSSGGAVTLGTNPQITYPSVTNFAVSLSIDGASDTDTITLVDGNGLQLNGGNSFTLGLGDNIKFDYIPNRNIWRESSRSDN